MPLDQVIAILGMSPSFQTDEYAIWRYGDAQAYDGTPKGAIRFQLENKKTVNVPDTGIFSPEGLTRYKEWLRLRGETPNSERNAKSDEARDAREREDRERSEKEKTALAKAFAAELEARDRSSVSCKEKIECAKAFALAQIFITENSDMKIQVATDTVVQTYNPTEDGKIGISIVKAPRQGSTELLQITASCKEEKHFQKLCILKRTQVYNAFPLFIKTQLLK